MPRTPSQDPDLDDLPGFAPSEEEPAVGLPDEPADELLDESNQPETPAPSTTSASPSRPASAPESPNPPPPPTGTSTDDEDEKQPDLELTEGLEYLAGGIFEIVGHLLNRMVKMRRRQNTSLWLVTDEEAEAFAAPMARIAERRLPEELKSGDAKDLIIAGSVATEYATHNAAGIPGLAPRPEQQQPQEPQPPPAAQQAPPPPPPPPPSAEQPHAPAEAPPLVGPDI